MIPEKEKAVAITTAMNNKLQLKTYSKTAFLSSQKEQMGQLLFALVGDTADRQGWVLFERFLGGYYKGAR